jgi:hypothetical protein
MPAASGAAPADPAGTIGAFHVEAASPISPPLTSATLSSPNPIRIASLPRPGF